MNSQQITNLLYTVYSAGFTHGANEGVAPKHGTFEAFNRLIISESPLMDGDFYDIKEKVLLLINGYNEYNRLWESITPGGSEFANDPKRCIEWIKEQMAGWPKEIVALKKQCEQQLIIGITFGYLKCKNGDVLPDVIEQAKDGLKISEWIKQQ